MLDQLGRLARQEPVLLIIEDVHWIDSTSLAVVAMMIEQVPRLPVLFVLTDPEDFRELLGTYHAAVREEIKRFEGFIAKYMGDGVLIYFGYPRAHEDDAERAVRAALGLARGIARIKAGAAYLASRIGIATGLVGASWNFGGQS